MLEIDHSVGSAKSRKVQALTYTPFFGSGPLDRNILVACILKAGVTLIAAII
jgi:hypothetical protein